MASRQQSTKIRAKRIGLSYFKEPHWFRRWKFILSVAAPVVAGLWLLVVAVQGNQRVYNAGPVSTAHAMFEKDCRVCHGPGPAEGGPLTLAAATGNRSYWLNVSDRACQTCHAGPRHNTEEAFTPRCATCHVEHFGRDAAGPDRRSPLHAVPRRSQDQGQPGPRGSTRTSRASAGIPSSP